MFLHPQQEKYYPWDLVSITWRSVRQIPEFNIEVKEIKVTHERFSIDGSAEDPSKAKDPPDHDNEQPEEEDVVNIHGIHTKIMLQWKLGYENQEIKVTQDTT